MSLLLIEVMACVTATDRSNDIYVTVTDRNNDNLSVTDRSNGMSLLLTEVMKYVTVTDRSNDIMFQCYRQK
jgi:hypothetical protein